MGEGDLYREGATPPLAAHSPVGRKGIKTPLIPLYERGRPERGLAIDIKLDYTLGEEEQRLTLE